MILIILELCHVSIAVTTNLNHINLFDYELSRYTWVVRIEWNPKRECLPEFPRCFRLFSNDGNPNGIGNLQRDIIQEKLLLNWETFEWNTNFRNTFSFLIQYISCVSNDRILFHEKEWLFIQEVSVAILTMARMNCYPFKRIQIHCLIFVPANRKH